MLKLKEEKHRPIAILTDVDGVKTAELKVIDTIRIRRIDIDISAKRASIWLEAGYEDAGGNFTIDHDAATRTIVIDRGPPDTWTQAFGKGLDLTSVLETIHTFFLADDLEEEQDIGSLHIS